VSAAGALLGLLLAYGCIKLIVALEAPGLHRPEMVEIDFGVLAFAAGAAVLTTVLFGLAPRRPPRGST